MPDLAVRRTGFGQPDRVSARLPDFPWDQLTPAKALAATHPGGLVDLSIGAPVDSVPASVQSALTAAANAPSYPATAGTSQLRTAIAAYLSRISGADVTPEQTLPTVGSKELVAWLPTLLGLGPAHTVVIPRVCYPTYEVGAALTRSRVVRADTVEQLEGLSPAELGDPALIWVNSPGNPHGWVRGARELAEILVWARQRGCVVASDECYLELGWEEFPVSALAPVVRGADLTGLISVHSLSKRSNLAGYRAGFVAGDQALIGELLAVRKHLGMIVPEPVQAAMVAALADEAHVGEQRERYRRRRSALWAALVDAGFEIDYSQAGLYLWATRGEGCWDTVDWLARRGILVAPGIFYGPAGERHVRFALTATDADIAAAVARLVVGVQGGVELDSLA